MGPLSIGVPTLHGNQVLVGRLPGALAFAKMEGSL